MSRLDYLDMSREEFMEKAYNMAHKRELLYGACSQAVLSTFQDLLDMPDDNLLRAATAFAGGISRQGMICGALMGGIMTISMKYGRLNMEDYFSDLNCHAPVRKLCSLFLEEFKSYNCRDISGYDLMKPGGIKEFYTSGDHDKLPPETAGKTARLVAGILYDLKEELQFDLEKVDETVE
jgi:C_GCAxxG_C_C family probable redox protein